MAPNNKFEDWIHNTNQMCSF